jgi:hypothetical protein
LAKSTRLEARKFHWVSRWSWRRRSTFKSRRHDAPERTDQKCRGLLARGVTFTAEAHRQYLGT